MIRASRTRGSFRAAAVVLALALPAEALAHCGVFFAGISSHVHHPSAAGVHAEEASDPVRPFRDVDEHAGPTATGSMQTYVAPAGTSETCVLNVSVFTASASKKQGFERSAAASSDLLQPIRASAPVARFTTGAEMPTSASCTRAPLPLRI